MILLTMANMGLLKTFLTITTEQVKTSIQIKIYSWEQNIFPLEKKLILNLLKEKILI